MNNTATPPSKDGRWSRFGSACRNAFHAYAAWLVSITWWRFVWLSLLLLIGMGIVHDLPPFSWTYSEVISGGVPPRKVTKKPPVLNKQLGKDGVDISIDERGVHISTRTAAPAAPTLPASEAALPPAPSSAPGVTIKLPIGADSEAVREAIDEARTEVIAAMEEAKQEAQDGAESAADEPRSRVVKIKFGEPLMPLTTLFILLSIVIKVTYKGTVQAQAKAAQATEVAESESLKRQVVEARMAAMQAQVEPHFLFNTLASIEHLIETDPVRAGKMQRNLIDLLRASMPTMREANAQGTGELGRELAMIRPYLEILKVRMEDRLQTEVRVSDGLLSAEFPPMMLQSLVENAIKHGLEPKAEGGQLTVSAEIVHGKLAVTVTDTGLGFGKAETAGTGIGLSNIRERLALLYGNKASLAVTAPTDGGTSVTITVPYVVHATDES
jgi:hypothetical protein